MDDADPNIHHLLLRLAKQQAALRSLQADTEDVLLAVLRASSPGHTHHNLPPTQGHRHANAFHHHHHHFAPASAPPSAPVLDRSPSGVVDACVELAMAAVYGPSPQADSRNTSRLSGFSVLSHAPNAAHHHGDLIVHGPHAWRKRTSMVKSSLSSVSVTNNSVPSMAAEQNAWQSRQDAGMGSGQGTLGYMGKQRSFSMPPSVSAHAFPRRISSEHITGGVLAGGVESTKGASGRKAVSSWLLTKPQLDGADKGQSDEHVHANSVVRSQRSVEVKPSTDGKDHESKSTSDVSASLHPRKDRRPEVAIFLDPPAETSKNPSMSNSDMQSDTSEDPRFQSFRPPNKSSNGVVSLASTRHLDFRSLRHFQNTHHRFSESVVNRSPIFSEISITETAAVRLATTSGSIGSNIGGGVAVTQPARGPLVDIVIATDPKVRKGAIGTTASLPAPAADGFIPKLVEKGGAGGAEVAGVGDSGEHGEVRGLTLADVLEWIHVEYLASACYNEFGELFVGTAQRDVHVATVRAAPPGEYVGMHPHSVVIVWWDIFILVWMICCLLSLPVIVSIPHDVNSFFYGASVTAFFVVDMVRKLLTRRQKSKFSLSTNTLGSSVAHYLRKNFLLDLIGLFPWCTLMYIAVPQLEFPESLLLVNILYCRNAVPILRDNPVMGQLYKHLQGLLRVGGAFMSVFIFMSLLICFLHYHACLLLFYGKITHYDAASWFPLRHMLEGNAFDQYVWALFNSVSNTFPVTGYKATDTVEQALSILAVFIGAVLYAALVGTISSFSLGRDASGRKFKEKLDEVNEFMEEKQLPSDVRRRVRQYYALKYHGKYFDKTSIMSELNKSLRQEIAIHNLRGLLSRVPFLRREEKDGRDDVFLGRVAEVLKAEYFMDGDIVLAQGEYGNDMYFIERGSVDIIVNGRCVGVLSDGAFFGEVALLDSSPRSATIKASSHTTLFRLSKDDFTLITDDVSGFCKLQIASTIFTNPTYCSLMTCEER
ncbi:hypothetical protein HK101_008756 [Irineochytrium annulatum]|nr:hypothetical protein HK101_008756 [Irineochytrium annulatum]